MPQNKSPEPVRALSFRFAPHALMSRPKFRYGPVLEHRETRMNPGFLAEQAGFEPAEGY
jgi:hypothetical protein